MYFIIWHVEVCVRACLQKVYAGAKYRLIFIDRAILVFVDIIFIFRDSKHFFLDNLVTEEYAIVISAHLYNISDTI